ncbi:hypothetical protein I7I50_02520 [Histoplasma capsulatum G186AR]|nr:hypothetical protein I7I50_02520 [Histoplasma capsulatum G186AR]
MATSTMSNPLSRAFTKRQQKTLVVSSPMPYRENQQKFAAGTIKRKDISLPVQLLSTTNLLAYNAPDLPRSKLNNAKVPQAQQPSPELKKTLTSPSNSSSSSVRSGSDSDITNPSSASSSSSIPSPSHVSGTPMTSPDLSPEENSPTTPEPNHLSGYFNSPKRSNTTHRDTRSSISSVSQTPTLPRRSLSHTKRSHQELARQRSLSKGSSHSHTPSTSSLSRSQSHSHSHSRSQSINRSHSTQSSTRSARLSQERLRQVPESSTSISTQPHPFGKELEQVNEVAEEFATVLNAVIVEEEQMLVEKGLYKFAVDEYIAEIEGLYRSTFGTVEYSGGKGYGGGGAAERLVSVNEWI